MIPTGLSFPEVLKKNSKEHKEIFKYGAITLFGPSFQKVLLTSLV
jgi:hypothetical protein